MKRSDIVTDVWIFTAIFADCFWADEERKEPLLEVMLDVVRGDVGGISLPDPPP